MCNDKWNLFVVCPCAWYRITSQSSRRQKRFLGLLLLGNFCFHSPVAIIPQPRQEVQGNSLPYILPFCTVQIFTNKWRQVRFTSWQLTKFLSNTAYNEQFGHFGFYSQEFCFVTLILLGGGECAFLFSPICKAGGAVARATRYIWSSPARRMLWYVFSNNQIFLSKSIGQSANCGHETCFVGKFDLELRNDFGFWN